VYAGFVDSELVRVDFGDLEPDGETVQHVTVTVRDLSRALAGAHVRQIAVGAPSTTLATVESAAAELERRSG
jgi:hypothetical protein